MSYIIIFEEKILRKFFIYNKKYVIYVIYYVNIIFQLCNIFHYIYSTQFYLEILDILMKKISFQKMAIDKALR